jgi:hypothetical protein
LLGEVLKDFANSSICGSIKVPAEYYWSRWYGELIEIGPMDGADDSAAGFPFFLVLYA